MYCIYAFRLIQAYDMLVYIYFFQLIKSKTTKINNKQSFYAK